MSLYHVYYVMTSLHCLDNPCCLVVPSGCAGAYVCNDERCVCVCVCRSTFAWACIQCICLGGLLVRVRNLMQEVQKEREIEVS